MLVVVRGGKATSTPFDRSKASWRAGPPSTVIDQVPGSTSHPVITARRGFESRL